MPSFIFFLILSSIFACATAATKPIIYLNSSDPSSWTNDTPIQMDVNATDGSKVRAVLFRGKNLGFVCGFYCSGSCDSYLFSVIVVGGGNPVVVWSANRDQPVKEKSILVLTRDGNLVLRDSDGSNVWSTNTAGISVAGMNITEFGNLVLFNDNGSVVWQSFDHPTDTLLAGQRLYEDQKLVSSSSPANTSPGLYHAALSMAAGFATFTEVTEGEPQMYYQLFPEPSSADQVLPKGHCRLLTRNEINSSVTIGGSNYAELKTGGFLVNLGTFGSNTSKSKLPLDSYIEYVRLDSDGHLKLYRHESSVGKKEIVDMVTTDLGDCQYPRLCGEYGFCNDGNCGCPEGVDGFQFSNGSCSRITPLSCQSPPENKLLVEVRNGTYFNVIDSNSAVSDIKDIEGCKQACLNNCSCGAAFFRYDGNVSDGLCYLPAEVLSMREGGIPNYNFSSATFIKVEIPSESPPPGPGTNRARLAAIIAGSGSAFLVILSVLILIFRAKFITKKGEEDDYMRQVPGMPVRFSKEELRVATNDFKEKLGGGGFGSVFKGVLPDGTEVAVKRLYEMGHAVREFLAEVETIGSIHHFNLVRLIGFSAEESCLLVYEYMSNGSLDNWIFHGGKNPRLDWQTRKKIVLDIAKGLAYLHEECRQRIIHLDIKPQNILLDENFNAKISDFGLSKLVDRNESHVTITMRGTPGYIAPECGRSRITTKVDIYSFGIVVLEIVAGRRNLDGKQPESRKHLLGLLQRMAVEEEGGRLLEIVEDLEEDEPVKNREEMVRMIRIAAWCLQDDHMKRPLMSTVVKVLEGVMEVDPNISYKFTHAMGFASSGVANNNELVSAPPQASILSNPR